MRQLSVVLDNIVAAVCFVYHREEALISFLSSTAVDGIGACIKLSGMSSLIPCRCTYLTSLTCERV